MKILVLNAGSGSQRCSLFELPDDSLPDDPVSPVWEAKLDATEPGRPPGQILLKVRRGDVTRTAATLLETSATAERTGRLLRLMLEGSDAALSSPDEIDAVGHRVVHGGASFHSAVRVDADVEREIERLEALAPLHNANNLTGIRVARRVLGSRPMACAVFDTAFHHTLPAAAATYAGPHAWLGRGIRRYGFHGTNFRWVAERSARLLGRPGDAELRVVACHLGSGCSLCATRGGRSLDTTMGFTPLDGIAMCTRSGAVDPGILLYLLRKGSAVDELERTLNKESGLHGLSGLPGDTRVLLPRVRAGDPRAILAWDVFIHRLRAGIGEMIAALGDAPHALVFTDVIGESEPLVRTAACEPFAFLGLRLDPTKNKDAIPDTDVATAASRVRVLVVQSREAWQIARECHALLSGPIHP
jgi:acetate kinase